MARALWWTCFAALIAAKGFVAADLDLFGDEAFYWQCSRRPAICYVDHPPMTAMLVRAGCALWGDTTFGVRFWFLALGALLPLGVFALAREVVGRRDAVLGAGATLVLPGAASLGLVATPDTPMLVLALAFLAAGVRAVRSGHTAWWALAGVAGMLGVATHYRFSIVLGSALLALSLPRWRHHWWTRGPWVTAVIVSLGVLPTIVFNVQTDFVPLRYYFEGRHGSSVSWPSFAEFAVLQLLVVTPALLAAYVAIVATRWRSHGVDAWLVRFCAILFGFFLLASPFENSGLPRLHWTLPAVVPLLVFLPQWLRATWSGGRRAWPALAVGLGPVVVVFGLGELGMDRYQLSTLKWNFTAWRELGHEVERRFQSVDAPDVVVAGSYRIGAEIDFELAGRVQVFVVDHPVNHLHGRAPQAPLWSRDERALRKRYGERALFVIGVHEAPHGSTRERDRHVRSFARFWRHDGDLRVESPFHRKDTGEPRRKIFSFFVGPVAGAPSIDVTTGAPIIDR